MDGEVFAVKVAPSAKPVWRGRISRVLGTNQKHAAWPPIINLCQCAMMISRAISIRKEPCADPECQFNRGA